MMPLQVRPNLSSFQSDADSFLHLFNTICILHLLFANHFPQRDYICDVSLCMYLWQRDREILRKRVSWVGCKQTCKQAIIISVQIKDRYSAAQTKHQIQAQNYGWFPERDDDFTRLLLLLFKKTKMRYLRQGMWRKELLAESTTHRMWASMWVVRCDWRNEVLSETWGTANS